MLRLASVFSSHALFLHSSPLTVHGVADGEVTVTVSRGGDVLASASGMPGEGGRFAVSIVTPAASFDPCRMTVTSGDERLLLDDILFGELWIAGGQSNMEMENREQDDYEERRSRYAASGIRAYQPTPIEMDAPALAEPDTLGEGVWTCPEDGHFGDASALATECCCLLSEALGVPVGFLNLNRGATRIESWLPRRAVTPEIEAYERALGRFPTEDNWNTYTAAPLFINKNFNQLAASYNRMAASSAGVTVRGVLWYQGCSNCSDECQHGMYASLLRALRAAWREDFSTEGAPFPFFLSTIYSHPYGSETVAPGRFNQSLRALHDEDPAAYSLVTVQDLSPAFAVATKNHPVHPKHKYELGARFAHAVLARVYGRGGQESAAVLTGVERSAGALMLRFASVGDGLWVKGGRLRGLYVAGADGKYLPADGEITAPDTLRVTHPAIPKPREALYSCLAADVEATLMGGGMGVFPFFTAEKATWGEIRVQARPFSDLSLDGDFVYRSGIDAYPRAIYEAMPGSGFCYDSFYSVTGRSLRVYAKGAVKHFGIETAPRAGAALDLENYRGLAISVFPDRTAIPHLRLVLSSGAVLTFPGRRTEAKVGRAWAEYVFSPVVPAGTTVARLGVFFPVVKDEAAGANIDRIYLVP